MVKPRLTTLRPRLQSAPSRLQAAPSATDAKRIRGRKLQDIRQRHFQEHPLCVQCQKNGEARLATQLDHIVALTNGGEDIPSNRQGLCEPCHAAKTALDLGRKG
jgi:5-methylcytosine-specific restriction protein A